MGWGSSAHGAGPHGSASPSFLDLDGAGATAFGGTANPDENYDGAGLTAFGGSAEIEAGVPPDATVTPFEFVRRVRPYEMERK